MSQVQAGGVWVAPIPLSTFQKTGEDTLYKRLEENEVIELLEKSSKEFFSFIDEYYIVMKTPDRKVIAKCMSKKRAMSFWEQAVLECVPFICEGVDSITMSSLEARFSQLAAENRVGRGSGNKSAPPSTEEINNNINSELDEFRVQFNLPKEILFNTFVCTYEGVLKTGLLYLSKNFLCYSSKMIPHKVIINFRKIKAIEKDGNFGLRIKTDKKDFVFSLFVKRDEAFDTLRQLWNLIMDRILRETESVLKSMETAKKSHFDNIASYTTPKVKVDWPRRISNQEVEPINIDGLETKEVHRLFRLTEIENIEYCVSDCFMEFENRTPIKGLLFVSNQAFGFMAVNIEPYWILVPYQEADLGISSLDLNLLRITTSTIEFGIRFPSSIPRTLIDHWNNLKGKEQIPIVVQPVSLQLVYQLYSNVDDEYFIKQRELENNWNKFFSDRKWGSVLLRDKDLIDFVRKGLPDTKRGEAWQILSGSMHYRTTKGPNYYKSLIDHNSSVPSSSVDDIEKDITRSFPTHPFYQEKEGLSRLRNVLLAYSWHNETVGYCQSMNIISALFLLYMEESDAFFLLATVCEILTSQYYNRGMLGSVVDVYSFSDLLFEFLPEIAQHFKKLSVIVPAITMPWFLCLYIGYAPIEIVLRILDAFFCEGLNVLFRIGLAIFKLNQEYILKIEDSYSILVMLKGKAKITEEILKIAFEEFGSVSIDIVRDKREAHKAEAIKALEDKARKDKVNYLLTNTKFNKEELRNFYNWAQTVTESFLFKKSQFSSIIIQFCPLWKEYTDSEYSNGKIEEIDLYNKLWKFFVKSDNDLTLLTFDGLIFGLSVLLKGSTEERWNVCVYLAIGNHNKFTSTSLYLTVDLLLRMENRSQLPEEIESFVKMVYDKAMVDVKEEVSVDFVTQQFILKPLLIELFNS